MYKKEELAQLGKQLAKNQFLARNWGNLSCREKDSFYITPTGCLCVNLNPEELVEVDLKKGNFDSKKKPSIERELHRNIYNLSDETQFVAHTHQKWASALSASGLSKLEISLDARTSMVGKTIPIIDYALPYSKKFARNFSNVWHKQKIAKAAIIAHKGGVFFAQTPEEIVDLASDLEIEIQKFLVNILRSKYPNLDANLENLTDTLLDVFIQKRHSTFTKIKSEPSNFFSDINYLLEDSNLEVFIKKDPIYRVFSNLTVLPVLDDFAQFVGLKVKPVKYKKAVAQINKTQNNKILNFSNLSSVLSLKNQGFLILSQKTSTLFSIEDILEKNLLAILVADLFNYSGSLTRFDSFLLRKNFIYRYSKLLHSEK